MDQKKIKERSHNENRFLTNYIKGNNSIKSEKRKNASSEYKNLNTEILKKSQSTLPVKTQIQNQILSNNKMIKNGSLLYQHKVSVEFNEKEIFLGYSNKNEHHINTEKFYHRKTQSEFNLDKITAEKLEDKKNIMFQAVFPKLDKRAKKKHQIGSLYHQAKLLEIKSINKVLRCSERKAYAAKKYGW